MTDLITIINGIVGQPPEGYEVFAYLLACIIGYRLIEMVFDLFRWVGKFFS